MSLRAAIIGAGPKRIDGRLKVTGSAPYASDHQPENMVYGHGVFSTIASGKIRNIDLSEAKASPGVIDIFQHLLCGRLDIDLFGSDAERVHQLPGIGFRDIRSGKARHGIAADIGTRTLQPVHRLGRDKQRMRAVQTP